MSDAAIEILRGAHGGEAISNLARQFGLTPAQAESAVKVLVPELARGIERQLLDKNGVADIMGHIATGSYDHHADNHASMGDTATANAGNDLLVTLLGSKTGIQQAAAYGGQESGVSAAILAKMLPYLATILMGAFAKQGRGALGDILSKLPQGGAGGKAGGGSGDGGFGDLGEILKRMSQTSGAGGSTKAPRSAGGYGIPGLPGATGARGENTQGGGVMIPGLPDDGAQAPQLPREGGGSSGRGMSAPMPGPRTGSHASAGGTGGAGDNPFGDITDIIKGGGADSGVLINIVRSVLGNVLGRSVGPAAAPGIPAKGGGWIGWIVKLLVMRFGWRIVTSVFRGVLKR